MVGNPKLECRPDGSWDVRPPICRLAESKIDIVPKRAPGIEDRKKIDERRHNSQRPLRPTKTEPEFGGRDGTVEKVVPQVPRPRPGFPRLREQQNPEIFKKPMKDAGDILKREHLFPFHWLFYSFTIMYGLLPRLAFFFFSP